jgi:phenylpyruvate tautomerase PptA (4-oxalocrotonate tautomerase family)
LLRDTPDTAHHCRRNIDNRARSADDQAIMPIYTCTTTESTLAGPIKAALARQIATIHSEINHVPSTSVNVVFHELAADNVYTDGAPASPVLVSGWIREGQAWIAGS